MKKIILTKKEMEVVQRLISRIECYTEIYDNSVFITHDITFSDFTKQDYKILQNLNVRVASARIENA